VYRNLPGFKSLLPHFYVYGWLNKRTSHCPEFMGPVIITGMVNTAKRTLYIWIGLTIAFVFGIFAPSMFGMDGFNGGFALSFFFIFLTIIGVIVIVMYWGRARAAGSILRSENMLVHWRYTPGEWQDYTEEDYRMDTRDKWELYRLVMVITAVVTIGFWLFHHDSGVLMIGFFFGLAALLSGVIVLTTGYDRRQNRKYQGEVLITRDGAYVGRKLHLWRGWGATLDHVKYDEADRLLLITYSMPSRTGRNSATVRVQVPAGQEQLARQVIAGLSPAQG
jgi:hypothetical protein